jgi:hypothetical protein
LAGEIEILVSGYYGRKIRYAADLLEILVLSSLFSAQARRFGW